MCMVDDAEPWKVFRSYTRRAAKEHTCAECSRTIHKGERYTYATGLYDEMWSTFQTCAHCEAASAWLMKACSGWMYHMVLEDLREHWDENELYRSDMLRALIDGMARKWRDGADPVPDVDAVRASVPTAA